MTMNRILRLALLPLLLAAPPLAAQSTPARMAWHEVLRGDDGTTVHIDSATVTRTGDATFTVRTSTWFPQRMELEDGRRFTREVDVEELNCGADSIRGFVSQLYADTSLVRLVPLAATWQPVPENRRPVFAASCAWLLGSSFASALSRSFGADAVDEVPRLADPAAARRALTREYPRALLAAGTRGEVTVRFLVGADGTVDPATLALVSLSDVAFAEPAFRVVAALRFRPARYQGTPVPVWVMLPLGFQPGTIDIQAP